MIRFQLHNYNCVYTIILNPITHNFKFQLHIFNYDKNMENKNLQFKERLLDELNYKGISKIDFAEKAGISINTLNMYLYRGSIPAADVAVKMAQVLNTTAEYLILGTENNKPLPKQSTKTDWQKNEISRIVNSLSPSQLDNFIQIANAYKNAVSENTSSK